MEQLKADPGKQKKGILPDIFRITIISTAYYLSLQLSFFFPDSEKILMAIWPAAGIGLASLILSPRRLWKVILPALFLTGVLADYLAGRPFPACIGFMAVNVIESAGCAILITRFCGPNIFFNRTIDTFALIFSAVFINAITAVLGAGIAALTTGAVFFNYWITWWIADGLGILTITPLIITWFRPSDLFKKTLIGIHSPEFADSSDKSYPKNKKLLEINPIIALIKSLNWIKILEYAAFLALWFHASYVTFISNIRPHIILIQPYMLFALIAWCTLRFQMRGTSFAIFLLATISIAGTIYGKIPSPFGGQNSVENLLLTQTFLGITAITSFLLTSSYTEKKWARKKSKDIQTRMQLIGDNIPDGMIFELVHENDGSARFHYASAGAEKLLGVSVENILKNSESVYSLVVENDKKKVTEIHEISKKELHPLTLETQIELIDKTMKWIRISGAPRMLFDGRIAWDGIAIDITEQKKAEKALQESNSMISSILNSIPQSVFWKDRNSVYLGCNENFSKSVGINNPSEIIGKTDYDLPWLPQDTEQYRSDDREVILKGKTKKDIIEPISFADGTRITASTTKVPLFDSAGNIYGVLGVFEDVTAKKIAEDALIYSEEKYRNLVETAQELIWKCDNKGHLTYLNPAWETALGYKIEEIIGKNFSDFQKSEINERDERFFLELMRNGKSIKGYETRLITKKGNELTLLFNVMPLYSTDGKLTGGQGTATDISEMRKAEESFRKAMSRNYTIIQTTMDGFWTLDINGVIIEVNNSYCLMSGYREDEILSRSALDFIVGKTPDSFLELRNTLIKKGELRYESKHRRKNGSEFDVEISVRYQPIEEGFFFVFIRDITARKKTEDALLKSLKEKELLLAEIHHRVKNNLQVVSSIISLESSMLEDEEVIHHLNNTAMRVHAMGLLHNKLYQSGNFGLIDIKDYLLSIIEQIQRLQPDSENIITDIHINNIYMNLETAMPCGLIVNEIITNSYKYAFPDKKEGEIGISIEKKDSNFKMIIYDTGKGLPEDIDFNTNCRLGMQLIFLLTKQLHGDALIERGHGTKYILTFKEILKEEERWEKMDFFT